MITKKFIKDIISYIRAYPNSIDIEYSIYDNKATYQYFRILAKGIDYDDRKTLEIYIDDQGKILHFNGIKTTEDVSKLEKALHKAFQSGFKTSIKKTILNGGNNAKTIPLAAVRIP